MDLHHSMAVSRWSVTLREAVLCITIVCLIAGWYSEHRGREQLRDQFSTIIDAIGKVRSDEFSNESWGGSIVTDDFVCEWHVAGRNAQSAQDAEHR